MLNRRARRRLYRQFQSQVEQERNGAPVPPEIAARMTKPAVSPNNELHQIYADFRNEDGTTEMIAASPAVIREVGEHLIFELNKAISLGVQKHLSNPRLVPLAPLQGVH